VRVGLSLLDAIAFEPSELPEDVLEIAKQCLLDWFGVTLAGRDEPVSRIVRAEAAAAGGNGGAAVVGTDLRTSAAFAALVNGTTSHALDYDDTNLVMMGHATAPVLPAVLAEAEVRGSSGAELLQAFVAGVETECRLGLALSPGHYAAGWHPTGTLGAIGAAAACASLLELDGERRRAALAIAATQAAGLKAAFGTMAKPLHAGKAAMNGLLAARLAGRGFSARDEMVDGEQGFAETHAPEVHLERLDELEGRWLIRETLFKYHAACYLTHSTIECARGFAADRDEIRAVGVSVHPAALKVCNIAEPKTGLEGKFSLRAAAAMALLGDDTADVHAFTDERMQDPSLIRLRDLVEVVGDESLAEAEARVTVITGTRRTREFDAGVPNRDLGDQWGRLEAKFHALAEPAIGAPRARALAQAVRGLDQLDSMAELVGS
jgi:2-methylcitrate dehydratase PrpD